MKIYVSTDDYRSYGFSPDLWGGQVIAVEVADDFSGGAKTFNPETGEWVADPPVPVDYLAVAEAQRAQILSHAIAVTADWRTELALGMLDSDDETKLKAWMVYIKAVKAVSTVTAPDIDWPEQPIK